jgi:hypothetical protein
MRIFEAYLLYQGRWSSAETNDVDRRESVDRRGASDAVGFSMLTGGYFFSGFCCAGSWASCSGLPPKIEFDRLKIFSPIPPTVFERLCPRWGWFCTDGGGP